MTDTVVQQQTEPEIDDELLEEAQRQLGDVSRNAAINEGLKVLVEQRRARRRRALERLQRMSAEGVFDYSRLEDNDE
jgi:Arc/MetJ family transcription regulator